MFGEPYCKETQDRKFAFYLDTQHMQRYPLVDFIQSKKPANEPLDEEDLEFIRCIHFQAPIHHYCLKYESQRRDNPGRSHQRPPHTAYLVKATDDLDDRNAEIFNYKVPLFSYIHQHRHILTAEFFQCEEVETYFLAELLWGTCGIGVIANNAFNLPNEFTIVSATVLLETFFMLALFLRSQISAVNSCNQNNTERVLRRQSMHWAARIVGRNRIELCGVEAIFAWIKRNIVDKKKDRIEKELMNQFYDEYIKLAQELARETLIESLKQEREALAQIVEKKVVGADISYTDLKRAVAENNLTLIQEALQCQAHAFTDPIDDYDPFSVHQLSYAGKGLVHLVSMAGTCEMMALLLSHEQGIPLDQFYYICYRLLEKKDDDLVAAMIGSDFFNRLPRPRVPNKNVSHYYIHDPFLCLLNRAAQQKSEKLIIQMIQSPQWDLNIMLAKKNKMGANFFNLAIKTGSIEITKALLKKYIDERQGEKNYLHRYGAIFGVSRAKKLEAAKSLLKDLETDGCFNRNSAEHKKHRPALRRHSRLGKIYDNCKKIMEKHQPAEDILPALALNQA